MSDVTTIGGSEGVHPVRIVQDIPVLYADGVTSHYYAYGIAKFYLSRIDPDPAAKGTPRLVNIVQVVMPADGFAQMVLFLEKRLQTMITEKIITQEQVDQIRKAADAGPTT
jgi:hypothetical protein